MRRRRTPRSSEGGFALLVVVILLALMTAATALSLDNAVASLRTHAGARASEMIKSAADFGVSEAIAQLQVDDVEVITNPLVYPGIAPANSFDIFNAGGEAVSPTSYIAPMGYPPVLVPQHPMEGDYGVRVGLRTAQRARAPAGEDVRSAYGQVVELQVEVQSVAPGVPPVQERVSVGIVIPRKVANSK
ncbi:MAG: hypothetical protein RIT81_02775 [Deltaproteobacteria bacterium]